MSDHNVLRAIYKDLKFKQKVFSDDGADVSLVKIFLSDGTSASVLYRLMQACSKRRALVPLALVFQYINKLLNQCVIGMKADFGSCFILMHPVGVVINSKVVGGERIVLESGVVIGDEKGRSPVLMNDIFVGAGAKIVGGVSLGNHVKVGANAVVVKDAAEHQTVVGIPARPVKK